jgi:uncharacterized protein YbdZ (MbtH family)
MSGEYIVKWPGGHPLNQGMAKVHSMELNTVCIAHLTVRWVLRQPDSLRL